MKLVVAEVEKTGESIKISLLWSDALNTVKTQFCFLKINENVFEHRRFEKRRVAKRKREGQFEKEASYNLPFAQKPRKTECFPFSFETRICQHMFLLTLWQIFWLTSLKENRNNPHRDVMKEIFFIAFRLISSRNSSKSQDANIIDFNIHSEGGATSPRCRFYP